ncbi:acetyltransferase [Teredinibacter sp. KSP-S5-2]|uniref:acetyltransferase n=1 Tax=Teredinibacter sp. KSP-S5-2 TaxID=3034506 RepID=UPI0029349749|nr:acetyltransferase [Teredinibacter sp. KSP-S5-2]WNO08634.1 acetyltransferase [Teredinibacter sp. KSP-S5-2]
MFLKDRKTGHLIEVVNINALFNLYEHDIMGRDQVGEELQEPEHYEKADLVFLSGEELPQCWVNPDYRKVRIPNYSY